MRYFLFILLFSLPCTTEATIATPIPQGETVIARQDIPPGFAPKKEGFFNRVASNMLQKRLKRILERSAGNGEQVLSILGFTCSVLAVILLFGPQAVIAAAALTVVGFILCIVGLTKRGPNSRKWIKALAITGIVLSSLMLILFLMFLLFLANNVE